MAQCWLTGEMPWGRRRRIGSNDLQEEKSRSLLVPGLGECLWDFSSLKGPTDTLSRPVGCRAYGPSGPSAHFRLRHGSSLVREVESADREGGRRDKDSVVQKLGPQQGETQPGRGCTLGSRRCDCASSNGFYRPSAVMSKSPQNICANAWASDSTASLLGNHMTGVSAKPQA